MLTLLFSACVLLGDSGEPKACTEIGCMDGVSLDFSLTDPGNYIVTATTTPDHGVTQCTVPLPFDGSETCSGPGQLGLSGSELPPDQQAISGMTFTFTDLTEVHLNVNLDGASIIDHAYPVSYTISQPNGPDCEPTCSSDMIECQIGDL